MCVDDFGSFSCKDLNCEPGTKICQTEDVYVCAEDGMSNILSKNCTDSQYCDDTIDPVDCKDMVCVPDEDYCDSDILKTCNSVGSGGTTLKDCTTDGGVCDGGLLDCVYVGEIGGTVSFSSTGRRGNFFNCTKDVTVVEFAQGFDLFDSTDLTWVIYEDANGDNTYQKIFDKTETVSSNGKGHYSTGTIFINIKSGRKYLFVTVWSGSRTFLHGGSHPVDMGFGSSFAGYIGNSSIENELVNPYQTTNIYNQQIKFVE